MKRRLSIILLVVALATVTGAALVHFESSRLLYPTPDTESAFLKNYSPEAAIKPFLSDFGWSSSGGHDGGSGHDYVTHRGRFELHGVMRPEMFVPLQRALINDVPLQLRAYGAQIIVEKDSPLGVHSVDYQLGKSIGRVMILPVTTGPSDVTRHAVPLPAGVVDAMIRIRQSELWFPKEPGPSQIALLDSMR